jgi:hypothetical protein
VYTFLFIVGAVADRTRGVAPDAWRRYAEVMFTGFGFTPAPERDADPMTDDQLLRAWPTPAADSPPDGVPANRTRPERPAES